MPITEEQKKRITEIAKKIDDSTDADYYRELVYNGFSAGGKIHIKPENRGKFTALKKRTGHSATWFKEHGTPAQKKMATFALNSKHWSHKHAGGGYLQGYGHSYEFGGVYDLSEEQIQELIRQGYEIERI